MYLCIFIYHPLHWLHLNYALLRSSTGLTQYVCLYIQVFTCIRGWPSGEKLKEGKEEKEKFYLKSIFMGYNY